MRERGIASALMLAGSAAVVLAGLVVPLVWALQGHDLADISGPPGIPVRSRHEAWPWLVAGLVGGLAALTGWALAHRRSGAAAEAVREKLGAELAERERQAHHERRLRERVEAVRERERQWREQLRAEVARLHHDHGPLGDMGHLRTAVLHLAIELVGARKGLLVARGHEEADDGDADLRVVASEGFRHDPRDSALARRFASEVIERDTTIREDGPSVADEDRTPADAEIENLLAIPIYIRDEFSGVVVCANRPGGFDELHDEVLLSLGDQAGAVLENTRLHGELRGAYLATVNMLAEAIEAKDVHLAGHSQVVADYVAAVADRLGMEPRRREALLFGSLLHDVGKLGISERILLKPAALTPEERQVVELHPRIGYHLLQNVPALRPIAPAVLHHHERFDGSGYPAGLRAEQIPLEARIVSVADSFSAMTGRRPYREPISVEEALEELVRNAGTQFDPEVVRLFIDEVHRNPPPEEAEGHDGGDPFADPELAAFRDGDDDVLGARALSAIDGLTLLYSHRHLHELANAEAERATLQGRGFTVVTVGLTELDRINERDGYAAGDRALATTAAAVQRVAGNRKGTACREGGRWLAVLLPEAEDGARWLCRELEDALAEGPAVVLGLAAWSEGMSGDDVIRAARRNAEASDRV